MEDTEFMAPLREMQDAEEYAFQRREDLIILITPFGSRFSISLPNEWEDVQQALDERCYAEAKLLASEVFERMCRDLLPFYRQSASEWVAIFDIQLGMSQFLPDYYQLGQLFLEARNREDNSTSAYGAIYIYRIIFFKCRDAFCSEQCRHYRERQAQER